MLELSADGYAWVKAIHVIAVIAWMAGLLYLPRLYVYHAQVTPVGEPSTTFKVMERRLLKAIMNPAMIVSLATGLLMVAVQGSALWETVWFPIKVACLGVMMACHMMMGRWRKAFAEDRNEKSHTFFRVANEVPTLLMIIIVIMVIVQPF